ncbi:TPA: hypothetical protein DCZ39_01635 [Patescibacteria group bacterium]|nr:hypothetical protein [Candidatus Gracilibacteria bacterium]
MANVSGWTESQSETILLAILGYIIVLLLLIAIHRKGLKKYKKIHEDLILSYDTMRYKVARAQYGNPALQDNKGISTAIEGDHKDYLVNTKAIKQEILSIEQKLGQEIISTEQWITIEQQAKKKNRIMTCVEIIGRVTTILTVGIYKLFW